MAIRKGRSGLGAKLIAAEHRLGQEMVEVEKHALDRMHYWAGVGLLLLATVLALHGAADVVYLSTAFGGTLACIFE